MNKKMHISYYCFDIDDNLLRMPTKINMINKKTGEKELVSSEKFAEIRGDKDNWELSDDAFVEFRDTGPRGENAFIEDMIYAVKKEKFAPSWGVFIKCLISGSLFSLITARGCAPDTLKKGVKWIIDNFLSDAQKDEMYINLKNYIKLFGGIEDADKYSYIPDLNNFSENELVKKYLDICEYYGVTYPGFLEKHKEAGGTDSPEIGKEIALKEFINKVQELSKRIGATISFGMSDDDVRNIIHVEKVFKELKEIYPDTIFRLYDTSRRGYVKKVIESKIKKYSEYIKEISQVPGLESSVMPFTQFNNMTNNLYPSGSDQRQDDFANQNRRQVKFLAKNSKEILGKKKKRIPRFTPTKKSPD